MPNLTGRVIAGRYDLRTPIGRGAMGVVWRAHDNLLDREVAVKEVVISALISAEERRNAYQRTLREARTAARLSHRGVVAIYDVVEEDGRPWIIMELVPSQSLDQILTVEGRLSPARAGRIGQQLLSALAAAHQALVLHRDVKPSNVLVATTKAGEGWDERAVLTDFGIAQFEGDPRLTQTGMVMGSPGFTAPERIRGNDATPASDLWSLGATIYAAVEGRGPYENRGGAITTMSAIINEDAPMAPHGGPLSPVIASLLRRDPRGRPSASLAARMFAQVLPRLAEHTDEPSVGKRTPTVKSAYIPVPASPAPASAPAAPVSAAPAPVVASPDSGGAQRKQADGEEAVEQAARDEAAEAELAGEESTEDNAEQAPDEQAAAASDSAADADATPEAGPDAEEAPEAEPAEEVEAAADAGPQHTSPPKSAVIPVPGVPSGESPADQSKKPKTPDTVVPLKGADTVIPGKSAPAASGYRPTEVAVPVARAISPEKPVSPEKPAPPKPTFTAAKPGPRPSPSFSAAPARPARTGRPTPPRAYDPPSPAPTPPSQRGADSARTDDAAQAAGTAFRTPATPSTPAGPSGAAGVAGYPGPLQPPPALSQQYTPGVVPSRGGKGVPRALIWVLVAVVAAIAIGVTLAMVINHGSNAAGTGGVNVTGATSVPTMADATTGFQTVNALNKPMTTLPGAGWTSQTVTKSTIGSAAAGYSIDVPPGWTMRQNSLETNYQGPGGLLVQIDLDQQSTMNMLAAETQVEKAAAPGYSTYRQQALRAVPVRGTRGSVWAFTQNSAPRETVNDIFFMQQTPGGVQDYAILVRSPSSSFTANSKIFDMMLQTFQTDPPTTTSAS
jgi:serine/threonine protein kinase